MDVQRLFARTDRRRVRRAALICLLFGHICAPLAGCEDDGNSTAGGSMSPQVTLDGSASGASQLDAGAMAQSSPPGTGLGDASTIGAGPPDTGAAPSAIVDAAMVPVPDAASSGDAAPSGDASAEAGTGAPPMIADFAKPGPYGMAKRLLNQGIGTVTGGTQPLLGATQNDPSAFTVFYPQNVKSGERLPLLTWGNGTFCAPTFYDELMNFIVSYGYVVVASNTADAGTGAEMLKAVDWALAQNDKADSPLHGLIDGEHIGSFGHSQGGEGAVNTASDPRIDAVAPLSAGPKGSGEAQIRCPAFYTLTADDVVTPEQYRPSYDDTTTPSVLGVTAKGDHDEYSDKADDPGIPGLTSNDALYTRPAIVAWFEWQLKGKAVLKSLFVGKDCGFCRDPTWKTFENKGF